MNIIVLSTLYFLCAVGDVLMSLAEAFSWLAKWNLRLCGWIEPRVKPEEVTNGG